MWEPYLPNVQYVNDIAPVEILNRRIKVQKAQGYNIYQLKFTFLLFVRSDTHGPIFLVWKLAHRVSHHKNKFSSSRYHVKCKCRLPAQ